MCNHLNVHPSCGKGNNDSLKFTQLVRVCPNASNMYPSQIYVEIERARLTKTLASIKEQSGEVKEAASILQELQVIN